MRKSLTLTALVGIGLTGSVSAAPKWAKKGDTIVKCKGVAKKGANDCGANGHACAGKATKDKDPNEWVYVPDGLCEKIGGKVGKKSKVK